MPSPENATVLVTGGHKKQALAICRSLGRRGYDVIAASHTPIAQSFFSRYASDTVVYENPADNERAFVYDLLAAIARHDVDVLLPTNHFTTISISRFRERLASEASVPVVEYETLLAAEDKARLLSIADEAGVPIPETYRPASVADLDEIATAIDYPAVVKYNTGSGALGIEYVDSPDELRAAYGPDEASPSRGGGEVPTELAYETHHVERERPLVQEYVPGETHDVNALFVDGEPRAVFTARRTSTFPRSGGRAVITEATDEPELVEHAVRLLERLEWHGVAEVEFKRDERDGQPKLLEINPRFWGNVDLAIEAGVDFPALLCELALTGEVTPPDAYDVGTTVIWLDEGFALNLWRSSDRLDYLRYVAGEYRSGARTTVELSDPAPHLVRTAQLGWRGVRSGAQGGLKTLVSR